MTLDVQQVNFHGWPNCLQLDNGRVHLIATTDVGPRVIYFGLADRWNEFAEFGDDLGKTGGDGWRLYGGHRLWHAPEEKPRTYYPDNRPVDFEIRPDGLLLRQQVEETTGIRKEIEISLPAAAAEVRLVHRLGNEGVWPVELAPWALSVMAPGGTAIVPLPPRGSHEEHLQPSSTISLWPYTDLSDGRWLWGREFVLLRQDEHRPSPQKIGFAHSPGWGGYWRSGHLFVKRFTHRHGGTYPDLGSSFELFTNDLILELESLGPLVRLAPGEVVEHVETWQLFEDVPAVHTEADVRAHVLPLLFP